MTGWTDRKAISPVSSPAGGVETSMTGPTWVQSRTAHGAHTGTAASKRAVQAAALRPASGTGPGERRQPSVRAVPQPKQVGKGLKASRSRHHAADAASTSEVLSTGKASTTSGSDNGRATATAVSPAYAVTDPSSPVTAAMAVASGTGDWSRTTTPFARSATKEESRPAEIPPCPEAGGPLWAASTENMARA